MPTSISFPGKCPNSTLIIPSSLDSYNQKVTGRWGALYVLSLDSNTLNQYSINPIDSQLWQVNSISTGALPVAMTMVNQQFIYVANYGGDTISGYSINNSGTTSMGLKIIGTYNISSPISLTNDGSYVYVASYLGKSISKYQINSNGSLQLFESQSLNFTPSLIAN